MRECLVVLWVAACIGASVGCGDLTERVESSVCESGTRWIGEDEGSPDMMPGEACLSCHSGNTDGPQFRFAGTVYNSGSQGERCFGAAGVKVVIKDAKGVEHEFTSNDAGNFYTQEVFETPYTAYVVAGGQTLPMTTPQTNGDCNSCHRVGGAASMHIFTGL